MTQASYQHPEQIYATACASVLLTHQHVGIHWQYRAGHDDRSQPTTKAPKVAYLLPAMVHDIRKYARPARPGVQMRSREIAR